jgi:AcrR family transcriptional regulator
MDTRDLWIEKGYEHFGLYGPERLSIKLIAQEHDIARTSFNYYFLNKEEFCDELIEKHYDLVHQFCDAGKLHCKKYLPDLHALILAFPDALKFMKQLFNHRHNDEYNVVFVKCNEMVEQAFALRLFMDYYKLPLTVQEAAQLHASLTDTWYSRLDIDDLKLEKSTSAVEEIMQTILALMKKSRSLNPFSKVSIPTFHDLT